ncbi:MAG: 4-(cytidine 5'-diphospho)-2-C-methyl-D-erythritol kinase [bacterium]
MFVRESTASSVTVDTPAKVNLFLQILQRRPDGYHDINSLFQAVTLFDTLNFSVTASDGVTIRLQPGIELPVDASNLITKAYHLIRERFRLSRGLQVVLRKMIPVSAGLGGGSADAAAVILACNQLFDLGLSCREMARLGLNIGSDIPFFFAGGQALVSGRGEVIRESTYPTDYQMLLVTPALAIATTDSYSALKRDLTTSKLPFSLACCRTVDDLVASLRLAGNDFEEVQFRSYPVLGEIRDELLRCGALLTRMSGSGPTMFGIFGSETRIVEDKILSRGDWRVHPVKPVSLSGRT